MKKYETPQMTVVAIESEKTILNTSPFDGAKIGGEYDGEIPT